MTQRIGGARILAIALPVALSNATVPLQGAIDTAVVGRLGEESYLAAVGLGAQIFSLLFASCNFLQIGTSGLTAQAIGARDPGRALDVLLRACAAATIVAFAMIALRDPIGVAGLALFEASPEAERLAALYVSIRIWAAPAELANYALMGWFAGQERTRLLLAHQLALSGANVGLNLLFVLGLGMDVDGVALATALASWGGLGVGLWLAMRRAAALRPPGWRPTLARVLAPAALIALLRLNRDLFLRTLMLVGSMAWMTRIGASLGDAALAANVVLMQFLLVSAYALDGFAIATESLAGQAAGARDRPRFRRAVVETSAWAAAVAAVATLALAVFAGVLIDLMTTAPEVRRLAREIALFAALTPLAGVAAFQLDGVFVAASAARAMRDAMAVAAACFVPLAWLGASACGAAGLWAALLAFLSLRAMALLARYPALEAAVGEDACRGAADAAPPGSGEAGGDPP